MKLYNSFFTLARAIPLAKGLTNKVVESIVTPTEMVDVVNDITADWESLICTYVRSIPWSPSWMRLLTRERKGDGRPTTIGDRDRYLCLCPNEFVM